MIMTHHHHRLHFTGIRIKSPTENQRRPLCSVRVSFRCNSQGKNSGKSGDRVNGNGIVLVNPKPHKGPVSKAIDCVESLIVKFMHNSSLPLQYLSHNFAPVPSETPPTAELHVVGNLPVSSKQVIYN